MQLLNSLRKMWSFTRASQRNNCEHILNMKLAIIGGGAAGFFLAINVKEMLPELEVTIFEQQKRVLSKVEISGGGRCNCTNSFANVTDLKQVYPRGANLLKHLFKQFNNWDAYSWFEEHGVPLVTQEDECVFPQAQDSHAIINCFLDHAKQLGVKIKLGNKIEDPEVLFNGGYDFVAVTVGGLPNGKLFAESPVFPENARSSANSSIPLTPCVPSLFTFNIKDKALTSLMGVVVEDAIASIPGTKFRTQGPLLITHWGMSGPAILKLSSHAARHLSDASYQSPLLVNWTGETNAEIVRSELVEAMEQNVNKLIDNVRLFDLQSRLWQYLLSKAQLQGKKCSEVGKKGINRLTDLLTNDSYAIAGRSHYKDEFVTCGGVPLTDVNKVTLESKQRPNLFFAGEVLDIDGITGGFNFQAAWTTAYAVAKGIEYKVRSVC